MGFFLSVPFGSVPFSLVFLRALRGSRRPQSVVRSSANCSSGESERAKRQPEAVIHAATGRGARKRKNCWRAKLLQIIHSATTFLGKLGERAAKRLQSSALSPAKGPGTLQNIAPPLKEPTVGHTCPREGTGTGCGPFGTETFICGPEARAFEGRGHDGIPVEQRKKFPGRG